MATTNNLIGSVKAAKQNMSILKYIFNGYTSIGSIDTISRVKQSGY